VTRGNSPALIERWRSFRRELDARDVQLLAVSKYAKEEDVLQLINAGQLDFAESRPQQLRDRAQSYPTVRWHMIGPVQKNKAKYIARHAAMWHSVENIDVAQAVAQHVTDRRLPVLLQVNIAGLAYQHGVCPQALPELADAVNDIPELQLVGLMCMAAKESDAADTFGCLRSLRDTLMNGSICNADDGNDVTQKKLKLCMGMSHDYQTAVLEGADMVRIGSGLFGEDSKG